MERGIFPAFFVLGLIISAAAGVVLTQHVVSAAWGVALLSDTQKIIELAKKGLPCKIPRGRKWAPLLICLRGGASG